MNALFLILFVLKMINPLILMLNIWPTNLETIFSTLAENIVSKLFNPSNKYGALSVAQYYSHLELTRKFGFTTSRKRKCT